jgi:hypothetical protein
MNPLHSELCLKDSCFVLAPRVVWVKGVVTYLLKLNDRPLVIRQLHGQPASTPQSSSE